MAEERKRRRGPGTIAMWLVVILVLYPLSMGPAAWIGKRIDPSGDSLFAKAAMLLYAPLLITVHATQTEGYLFRYLSLFVDPEFVD
jgi:hypothetical protein